MKRQATKTSRLNVVGVEGLHDLRACSRSLRHRPILQIRIERTMLLRWMFVNPLACGAVKTREQGDMDGDASARPGKARRETHTRIPPLQTISRDTCEWPQRAA